MLIYTMLGNHRPIIYLNIKVGDKERMISEELINSLKSVWMPPHLVQRPNWIKKKSLQKNIYEVDQ